MTMSPSQIAAISRTMRSRTPGWSICSSMWVSTTILTALCCATCAVSMWLPQTLR
jgi:hypothetical protein